MADAKKPSGGGSSDIWWFLGLLAIFFFLWVSGGGPQRAEEAGLGDVKLRMRNSSNATSTPSNTKEPTYVEGQIIY